MKLFKLLFFVLLTSSVICSCATTKEQPSQKHPTWMNGSWKGTGLQLNFIQTWSVELEVKDKEYKIFYPTLDCGGEWVLVSATSNKAEFIEKIIKGKDRCVHNGRVVITRVDENHLSFSYFSPDSGKLEAHSTLVNDRAIDSLRS